jgi:hypothetical protein
LLIKVIQRFAPMNAETQCGHWWECHSGVHRREDVMRRSEYFHECSMNLAKHSRKKNFCHLHFTIKVTNAISELKYACIRVLIKLRSSLRH